MTALPTQCALERLPRLELRCHVLARRPMSTMSADFRKPTPGRVSDDVQERLLAQLDGPGLRKKSIRRKGSALALWRPDVPHFSSFASVEDTCKTTNKQ